MKNIARILITAMAVTIMGVFFTQCDKETSTPAAKVTGKITLASGAVADGAVVVISSEPNAATVIARTITDELGMYSFLGIENGTYYMSARYEPSNNNNLKSMGTVVLTGKEVEVTVSGDQVADITMAGMVSSGDGVVSLSDGWIWDNTHSTIGFDFPYDEFNGLFKGHFSRAGFDVLEFDEMDPAATKIKAWVDITSIETGSASPPCGHGRDGITGCISGSFGVDLDVADTVNAFCQDGTLLTNWPNESKENYDLWGDQSATSYMKQSAIIGSTGVATFESTSVEAYGTGYHAKGDFTFMGVSKSVDMYFSYIEGYSSSSKEYSSFFGTFKFAALADFGVTSGHVGNASINVSLAVQFNKAL